MSGISYGCVGKAFGDQGSYNSVHQYGSLDQKRPKVFHFGPKFVHFSALHHSTRAVHHALPRAHADRVLVGAWNPML